MDSRQKEIAFEKIFKQIKSLIGSICYKRYNLDGTHLCPECPDCEGRLLEKIQEDDYKKIRKFEGNKSRQGTEIFENLFEIDGQVLVRGRNNAKFSTYLTSVLKHAITDYEGGRYVASKKAIELGKCAEELDYQIWKGSTSEEAYQHIITIDECKKITFDEAKNYEKKIKRKTRKLKPEFDDNTDLIEYLVNKEFDYVRSGRSGIRTGIIDEELENEEEKRNKIFTDNNPLSNLGNKEAEEKYKEILKGFFGNLEEEDNLIFKKYYFTRTNILGIAKSRGKTRYFVVGKIKNMMNDLLNLFSENNILPPGYKDESSSNFLANQKREDEKTEKRNFEKKQEKDKESKRIKEERDKSYPPEIVAKAKSADEDKQKTKTKEEKENEISALQDAVDAAVAKAKEENPNITEVELRTTRDKTASHFFEQKKDEGKENSDEPKGN